MRPVHEGEAPGLKIIAGGGFVNTELRDLSEPAVFDYLDFITLDDGELPFLNILKHLRGEITREKAHQNVPADRSHGDLFS